MTLLATRLVRHPAMGYADACLLCVRLRRMSFEEPSNGEGSRTLEEIATAFADATRAGWIPDAPAAADKAAHWTGVINTAMAAPGFTADDEMGKVLVRNLGLDRPDASDNPALLSTHAHKFMRGLVVGACIGVAVVMSRYYFEPQLDDGSSRSAISLRRSDFYVLWFGLGGGVAYSFWRGWKTASDRVRGVIALAVATGVGVIGFLKLDTIQVTEARKIAARLLVAVLWCFVI